MKQLFSPENMSAENEADGYKVKWTGADDSGSSKTYERVFSVPPISEKQEIIDVTVVDRVFTGPPSEGAQKEDIDEGEIALNWERIQNLDQGPDQSQTEGITVDMRPQDQEQKE